MVGAKAGFLTTGVHCDASCYVDIVADDTIECESVATVDGAHDGKNWEHVAQVPVCDLALAGVVALRTRSSLITRVRPP
jgi:hypothetical protein